MTYRKLRGPSLSCGAQVKSSWLGERLYQIFVDFIAVHATRKGDEQRPLAAFEIDRNGGHFVSFLCEGHEVQDFLGVKGDL